MGKIDTSEWKEFSVCELFGKSRLGKYHSPESLVESETGYPYICASNQNNGVNQKMSSVSGDDVRPTPQDIISWGKQCPYFTFHEEPCVTGQGMYYIVVPKYIPRRAIRYVITVLQSAVEGKFGYSNCFIGSSMDDLSIKLPATPNGAPDWAYMESYMANLETKVAESLTMLQAAKDAETKKVDTREWGEFRVGELFEVKISKSVDKGGLEFAEDGEYDFIGRTPLNNGIQGRLNKLKFEANQEGTYSIAQIGMHVCQYRERKWYASQNIFILTPFAEKSHKANKFIATVITRYLDCAYGEDTYATYPTAKTLPHLKIKLPVDKTGQPDWTYMEEYMRKVEERVKKTINTFCVIRNIKFDC